MASSRIFVKALPPSFTEDEFRNHFSQNGKRDVTDAKFFPRRRIGYVGFRTPEDAQKAVKYFNKTFIRMSRIGVEIATPIDETNVHKGRVGAPTGRRDAASTAHQIQDENPMKRKREVPTQEEQDPKMKEFLNVMRPKSKSKSWANGDPVEDSTVQQPTNDPSVPAIIAEEASDDEYETVPKKIKVRTIPEGHTITATETQMSNKPLSEQPEQEAPAPAISDESPAEKVESDQPAVSDADWARSRTSRLLGLLDDDEEEEAAAAAATTAVAEPESRNEMLQSDDSADRKQEEQTVALDSSDHGALPPTTDTQDDADSKSPVDTEIETARTTMRLFVRNLPYDVTSEALEAEFAPYGNLEEVCPCSPFSYSFIVNKMITDRDNLCFGS
jgi:multiple RNA-binding domain-containing protein 1